MKNLKALFAVMQAECSLLASKPIYWACMVVIPLFLIFFFTNLMGEGLPTDMPVGIVDEDQSATSRKLMRNLDAFQESHIVAHYQSVSEARKAVQKGEIYAFFYIPAGTEAKLIAQRQPTISFYYNSTVMVAGSLTYKDMRAIATLGQAAFGAAQMQARGLTEKQIKALLQPITTDVHPTNNPWLSYNVYLSTTMIPASLALFIFLITTYSIGAEIKFEHAKMWLKRANNNIVIAIIGKMLPQTLIWSLIIWTFEYWLYYAHSFPHNCSWLFLIIFGLVLVLAAQGFGIFVFGLVPSLRMSMSVSALWAVLSFSVAGFTFPVTPMDPPLQALSWLFPIRSYFMIYQMNVLNGFPVYYSWPYFLALLGFILLPLLMLSKIKKVLSSYIYIP